MRLGPISSAASYDPQRRLDRATAPRRASGRARPFGKRSCVHDAAGSRSPRPRLARRAPARPLAGAVPHRRVREDGPGAEEDLRLGRWRARGEAGSPTLRGCFSPSSGTGSAQRGVLVRDQLGQRPAFTCRGGRSCTSRRRSAADRAAAQPAGAGPGRRRAVPRRRADLREDRVLFDGRAPRARRSRRRLDARPLAPAALLGAPLHEPSTPAPPRSSRPRRAERLAAAIRQSTEGAQHVGVLLSGGLDSTSVAAIAAGALGPPGGPARVLPGLPDYRRWTNPPQIAAVVDRLGLPSSAMDVPGAARSAARWSTSTRFGLPEFSSQRLLLARRSHGARSMTASTSCSPERAATRSSAPRRT